MKHLRFALILGLACCGGSPASGFPGTWTLSSGTTQIACGVLGGNSNDEGTFTVTASGSQLTSNFSQFTCQLGWLVQTNNLAAIAPDQSCTLTQDGVTALVTFGSGTATLLDSTHLTVTASGSGPLTDGGPPNTCTATFTFTAFK